MISSLPGKALRMPVDNARLADRFNMRSKAKPGKLDIKRCEPGILFISLPICFTLQTSDYDVVFDFLC